MTIYFDYERASGLLNKVASASKARAIEHVWERLEKARREVYGRQKEKARCREKDARRREREKQAKVEAGIGDRRKPPKIEEWVVPPTPRKAIVERSILVCFQPGVWYRSIEIRNQIPEVPMGSVAAYLTMSERKGLIACVRNVGVETKHGPGWGYHLFSITDAGIARLKDLSTDEEFALWQAHDFLS